MKKTRITLNKKERDLYYSIKNFINKNGYSPSYRELLILDIYKSISSIMDTLLKLENLGYLTLAKDKNGRIKARTIKINEEKNIL